jgi:hypothetical protein
MQQEKGKRKIESRAKAELLLYGAHAKPLSFHVSA